MNRYLTLAIATACLMGITTRAATPSELAKSLLFHAAFDQSADADFAKGDKRIYTADNPDREGAVVGMHNPSVSIVPDKGRWGGAMQFGPKTQKVVFYRGDNNVPYSSDGFSGTVSLWMQLDPDRDLEPGYVDPLQITDKTWNNACLFLDYTRDDKPRHFRLGVFSDFEFWNPTKRQWDDVPVNERPMVDVARAGFSREKWTHVALVYDKFNSKTDATAQLYLNGQSQGTLTGEQQFTWDTNKTVIILGIYYTGLIDDLAVFNRALGRDDLLAVMENSVGQLYSSTAK